jgi:hypothetical protein
MFQIGLGRKLTQELWNEIHKNVMRNEEDKIDKEEFMKCVQQIQTNEKLFQAKPYDAKWLYTAVAVDHLKKKRNVWLLELTNKYLKWDNLTPIQIDITGNFKSLLNESRSSVIKKYYLPASSIANHSSDT